MDPPSASVQPRLTADQALALANGGRPPASDSSRATVVRFGMFTGNLANIGNDANHTLQGATRVSAVPAWIVATYGLDIQQYGSRPAPLPGSTPVPSPTVAPCPRLGAGVVVIRDSDKAQLVNVSGSGSAWVI